MLGAAHRILLQAWEVFLSLLGTLKVQKAKVTAQVPRPPEQLLGCSVRVGGPPPRGPGPAVARAWPALQEPAAL